MKIAQVCPYNIFRPGGVQSHILALSQELKSRGHEVKIIAPYIKGIENNDEDIILAGRCAVLAINKTQIEISVAPVGGKKNPITQMLKKERFDVMHYHEPWVPALSIQLLSNSNCVNVGTFHSTTPNTILSRSLETIFKPVAKYVVNSLDVAIAVSESPTKYLKEFYTKDIKIIPNGIDLHEYHTNHEPFKKYKDGKVNIFFIGRLDKRKGVIYLIKAFRKLKQRISDVRLLIGGKGEELEKLQKYVRRHSIKDIEFLGFVSEENKPRYYATCDIFCSPALYGESFGIVLAEAMACGKPIIPGDNRGYRSVIKGRAELLLVNPKKTDRFTQLLRILVEDQELRDFIAEWGLKKVQDYAWPKVCDEVLKTYEEARNKRSSDTEKAQRTLKEKVGKLSREINIFE
jgi:phosphatidylinositol alpha-mannosyltransferase